MRNNERQFKEEKEFKGSNDCGRKDNNQTRNKNGRGNKRNSRNSKKKDWSDEVSTAPTANDVDYYFVDKQLAEDAATIAFPTFLGTKKFIDKMAMPTALVLWMNPSPGCTALDDTTGAENLRTSTGANMAAQKLYTRLSVASGRTANYEPNDVLMAILATTEVATQIESMRRLFGIFGTYNMRNRAYPLYIMRALGIDENDFVANASNYRMQVNMLINRINQIPMVWDLGYVRKSTELYQRIFIDAVSDQAQTIIYAPKSTWVLDETTEGGSTLRTYALPGTPVKTNTSPASRPATYYGYGLSGSGVPMEQNIINDTYVGFESETYGNVSPIWKFSEYIKVVSHMVDQLLNSTTLNMVYADMLNYQAKFSMNFLQLDFISDNYIVSPEYNETALWQIHNAVAVGTPTEIPASSDANHTAYNNVVPMGSDSGAIKYNPRHFASGSGMLRKMILDFPTSTPTLDMKIDAVKFSAAFNVEVEDEVNIIGVHVNDHYVTSFTIIYGSYTDAVYITKSAVSSTSESYGRVEGDNTPSGDINQIILSALSKFHSAPMLFLKDTTSALTAIQGDTVFTTFTSQEWIRRVLDLEYQGLFELRTK